MQAKIASRNCKQKLQAEIASRNCKQELQAGIARRNCKQKLQARFEFKTKQIMKLLNQKAKVTFFFYFIFDRNQPMTQPSAGKKLNRPLRIPSPPLSNKLFGLFMAKALT